MFGPLSGKRRIKSMVTLAEKNNDKIVAATLAVGWCALPGNAESYSGPGGMDSYVAVRL